MIYDSFHCDSVPVNIHHQSCMKSHNVQCPNGWNLNLPSWASWPLYKHERLFPFIRITNEIIYILVMCFKSIMDKVKFLQLFSAKKGIHRSEWGWIPYVRVVDSKQIDPSEIRLYNVVRLKLKKISATAMKLSWNIPASGGKPLENLCSLRYHLCGINHSRLKTNAIGWHRLTLIAWLKFQIKVGWFYQW